MLSDVQDRMASQVIVALSVVGALLTGCNPKGPRPTPRDLSPSRVRDPQGIDAARFATTEDCTSCHTDVGSHWLESAHAYASFDNPWYRASIDAFREERGPEASRFCAGCHDPLLLVSGDIDGAVSPDNDLAYAGITCLVCHSAKGVTADGNASLELTDAPIPIPDPAVPEEVEAHRARLTLRPLRSSALCGACHRSFTGTEIGNAHHLSGIDDLGDWQGSAFGGGGPDRLLAVRPQRCQDCHMPEETPLHADMAGLSDQSIRSHRWAASHTALAIQLPDQSQFEAVASSLVGSVSTNIAVVVVDSKRFFLKTGVPLRGGEHLAFEVVVHNERTGHRFPGGARDLHDVWLEFEVQDANGVVLGRSGRGGGLEEPYVLRSTILDAAGGPERLHRVDRFFVPAFDRTIAAHDAQVVRYTMVLPEEVKLPLHLTARVLHRKHNHAFQDQACKASRSPRGIAFARGAFTRNKIALDPCRAQPITEVAATALEIGRARDRGGTVANTTELVNHGVALLNGRQEDVELAIVSLEHALGRAEKVADRWAVAEIRLLLARAAVRKGRRLDALDHALRAESLVGPQPAIDRVRGDAHAAVWRWSDAVEAYDSAAQARPSDPTLFAELAAALGSLSRNREALMAADRGLLLAPRHEGLLRSRALALQALAHPDAERATTRWLRHRSPDLQPVLLRRCEQEHVVCARDRQPIPTYPLKRPAPKTVRLQGDHR